MEQERYRLEVAGGGMNGGYVVRAGYGVTPILAEYLSGNRGPDPADPDRWRSPDYGVTATLAGPVLDVLLTFRAGSVYCCCEWGCHLALSDGKRWDGLRRRLAAAGVVPHRGWN